MGSTGPDDKGLGPDDLMAEGDKAAELEARQRHEEARKRWRLAPVTVDALATRPPSPRWLLERRDPKTGNRGGFARMGKVGIIAAPGGTGKTMAVVGLALAVASGRDWLRPGAWSGEKGHEPPDGIAVATPGRVALLLGEEDAEDATYRLHHTAGMMGIPTEDRALVASRLVVAPLAGQEVSLVDAEGQVDAKALELMDLLTATAGDGWSAIIVDPLSRFAGIGAETDNALATRFVQALERLTRLPGGPAVFVVHHERKGGGDGADAIRGSSGLVDGARWALRLVPVMDPKDQRRRWRTKSGDRAVALDLAKTNYTAPTDGSLLAILDGKRHGSLRLATKDEAKELETAQRKPETTSTGRVKRGSNAESHKPLDMP